jgi:hypothetical protein
MYSEEDINFFIFLRLSFTFFESVRIGPIFLRLHPNYLVRRNFLRL